MYEYFKGKLISKTQENVIVEVAGIGYKIFIPINTFSSLPALDEQVVLYTSFIIRENSQALYGFTESLIKTVFEKLLSFSGIGPKTALSIIGHFSLETLRSVVERGDAASLAKVPGLGKKTAEKLLIELRSVVVHFPENSHPGSAQTRDALDALINLGYSHSLAQKMVEKAAKHSPGGDLSTWISLALKKT